MRKYNLSLFVFTLLIRCAATVNFTDNPPSPADMTVDAAAQPAPDMASKPTRISKLDDIEYWWWSNPLDPWEPDYARFLNGPLWLWKNSAPSGYKPHYDNQLRTKCLYYWTADQKWRCLPGWAQFRATLPLDGYYETGDWQCPLVDTDSWVQAIPRTNGESNTQPYLIMYDTEAGGFRVYEKIPVRVEVWAHIRQLCTRTWDALNAELAFYKIGGEVSLDKFAEPSNPGIPE